jgi:hypothetical protein
MSLGADEVALVEQHTVCVRDLLERLVDVRRCVRLARVVEVPHQVVRVHNRHDAVQKEAALELVVEPEHTHQWAGSAPVVSITM